MPAPSVTYTFSNSTTADASQVNQNFTDIINGVSDGTKDLSISALTCAGTATLNGNVNLGNASGDDLTITASLASTIAIKTTNSYDIGSSTLGLRSIYFGSSGGAFGTRLIGGAVTGNITLTLPITDGDARDFLQTDGSGTMSWQPHRRSAWGGYNVGIACSVASNALTIALKGADGNDASATNPVEIPFRSSTAATGTVTNRTVTAALSMTVSSGSTLGHTDGTAHPIYVYALDNSGTVELAVSHTLFDDGTRQSTTAEGGAGGADSNAVMYSTTARTDVPVRLLARLTSNQTTAGTWAAVPTEIAVGHFEPKHVGVRARTAAGQSMLNTDTTIVVFGTEIYDTHGAFNSSTGVFTAPAAGYYHVAAHCQVSDSSAAGIFFLDLYQNGSNVSRLCFQGKMGTNTENVGLGGSAVVKCAVGDTLDVRLTNQSGANETLIATAALNWIAIDKFYDI